MFHSRLIVREAQDCEWEIHKALVYHGAWDAFVVPPDFRTDFASVPRLLWPLFPPYGWEHTRAAVLHDWLYVAQMVSRKDADGIFRRTMRELGMGRLRRWTMYLAVRAFGWLVWHSDDQKREGALMLLRRVKWMDEEYGSAD